MRGGAYTLIAKQKRTVVCSFALFAIVFYYCIKIFILKNIRDACAWQAIFGGTQEGKLAYTRTPNKRAECRQTSKHA